MDVRDLFMLATPSSCSPSNDVSKDEFLNLDDALDDPPDDDDEFNLLSRPSLLSKELVCDPRPRDEFDVCREIEDDVDC